MKQGLIGMGLLTFVALGCAPINTRHPKDHGVIPFLSRLQILGLQRPVGMVKDKASGQWVQPEVLAAYQALKREATNAGWKLTLVSGYRSFATQRSIWNRKYGALSRSGEKSPTRRIERVMKYTSIPGISRHHWGTDLDLGEETILPSVVLPIRGDEKRMRSFYDWLGRHAPAFGFCKAYRGGPGAIQDEPWHWSYVRLASEYSYRFQQIGDFEEIDRQGVDGWEWIETHFMEIKRLQVDSVDPECNGEMDGFTGASRVKMPVPPPL